MNSRSTCMVHGCFVYRLKEYRLRTIELDK